MSRPNPKPQHEDPEYPIRSLRRHQHLIVIYENKQQKFAAVIPLFREALERGEQCLYLADESSVEEVRTVFHEGGVDVDGAEKRGALSVTMKPGYLTKGVFDPDAMVKFLKAVVRDAKKMGFTGFCGAGEMTWDLRMPPGFARLVEYEAKLDDFLITNDSMMMCLFNRKRFSAETLLDVIKTHPVILYGGRVYKNPYYVPHRCHLGHRGAEMELRRVLDSLQDYEMAAIEQKETKKTLHLLSARLHTAEEEERRLAAAQRSAAEELRRSERLLRHVLDALPVGVAVVDLAGDIILTNPASRRIWGRMIRKGSERRSESKGWWHDTGKRIEPAEWASMRAIVKGETSLNEVIDIETFDGIRKVMQNSAVPIRDTDGRITGAVIVNEDVSARKKVERELNNSYNQLRTLAGRLMRAQDEERRRIARQLHETTVQSLIALKMDLAKIARSNAISDVSLAPVLDESMALTDQSLQEVRTLSHLLHPPLIEEAGLLAALRWYVAGFSERSGIKVTVDAPSKLERLAEQVEIAIFRIVQEALTNIHRHSGSRRAKVSIKSDAKNIHLKVADAGKGLDRGTIGNVPGVGIEGMRERVVELGGTLVITSGPKGTAVSAVIPKRKDSVRPKLVS